MAVFQGLPKIRLEGDTQNALAFIPDAKALLGKAQSVVGGIPGGAGTYSLTRRIDDRTFVHVLTTNGQNIITVYVEPSFEDIELELPEFETPLVSKFPEIYSGMVLNGRIIEDERTNPDGSVTKLRGVARFAPTDVCAEFHEIPNSPQFFEPLRVEPSAGFPELKSKNPDITFSQYVLLRPSMYSGKMAAVVQAVMGLGRGHERALLSYKDYKPETFEKRWASVVKRFGHQIWYDYRFSRTHGIHTAADGKLWLIEISITRGVLAMPLPMFPESDSAVYLERVRQKKDKDLEAVILEFGGIPTGASFAHVPKLQEKIDSGEVLQLLQPEDVRPFYQNSAYSTASGWTFNSRGTEAHNTGWRFIDEDTMQRAVHYQINIEIGPLKERREPGEPIADGTANISRQSEGIIVRGTGKFGRFVPMKFHEPLIGGLLSHDGRPYGAPPTPRPKCDTTMFVCFVNDNIKVVKFYQASLDSTEHESFETALTNGECMLVGSWDPYYLVRGGGQREKIGMYSNDFDDRNVTYGSEDYRRLTATDDGYNTPVYGDFLPETAHSFMTRVKVFKKILVSTGYDGRSSTNVVAVPGFHRNAYYYSNGDRYERYFEREAMNYTPVADPYIYFGWRDFPNLGGGCPFCAECELVDPKFDGTRACGGHHRERRIVCETYFVGDLESDGGITQFGSPVYGDEVGVPGNRCQEYTDTGPWAEHCDNMEEIGNLSSESRNRREDPYSRTIYDDPLEEATLNYVGQGINGIATIPPNKHDYTDHQFYWMRPSPDPDTGVVQMINATYSALGKEAAIYEDNMITQTTVKLGVFPVPADSFGGHPCFVGVNGP